MIFSGVLTGRYSHEIFPGEYCLGGTVMGYSLGVFTGRYCHDIL